MLLSNKGELSSECGCNNFMQKHISAVSEIIYLKLFPIVHFQKKGKKNKVYWK
jgi:hypothetical protein